MQRLLRLPCSRVWRERKTEVCPLLTSGIHYPQLIVVLTRGCRYKGTGSVTEGDAAPQPHYYHAHLPSSRSPQPQTIKSLETREMFTELVADRKYSLSSRPMPVRTTMLQQLNIHSHQKLAQ